MFILCAQKLIALFVVSLLAVNGMILVVCCVAGDNPALSAAFSRGRHTLCWLSSGFCLKVYAGLQQVVSGCHGIDALNGH